MGVVERVVVAAVLVAVAVAVALVVSRRRPDAPVQAGAWPVPTQLDRADFDGPDKPWLVVVFSSSTCESCAKAVTGAGALVSDQVAVQEVEVGARKDLHDRYGVEAVPTTVLADADGVVRASFVGAPSATELWAAVAEVRGDG
jgi:hypothetical protein